MMGRLSIAVVVLLICTVSLLLSFSSTSTKADSRSAAYRSQVQIGFLPTLIVDYDLLRICSFCIPVSIRLMQKNFGEALILVVGGHLLLHDLIGLVLTFHFLKQYSASILWFFFFFFWVLNFFQASDFEFLYIVAAPPAPSESNGYLRVRCNGGLNQQRTAVGILFPAVGSL